MNIIQALDDPQVFGPFFRGPTWVVWRVVPRGVVRVAADTRAACALHQAHRPQHATNTATARGLAGIGRRGGKSFILAIIAVFLACFQGLASAPRPR